MLLTCDIRRWCELLVEVAGPATGYDDLGLYPFEKNREGLVDIFQDLC